MIGRVGGRISGAQFTLDGALPVAAVARTYSTCSASQASRQPLPVETWLCCLCCCVVLLQ